MSKKKMCPIFGLTELCRTFRAKNHRCPKHTNDKCELIPKKPKTKTFKAWVEGDIAGNNFTITTSKSEADRWPKKMSPCSITIATKYLKGK